MGFFALASGATTAALLGQTEEVARLANGGYTPLHHACWQGQARVVQLLLDKGADLHFKTDEGFTPLHVCMLRSIGRRHSAHTVKSIDPMRQELKCCHEVNKLYSLYEHHDEVVKILLDAGAHVNELANATQTYCPELGGYSPLHFAAQSDWCPPVRLLLGKGADMHAMNSRGETPEDIASSRQNDRAAALLRVMAKRQRSREAFAMGQHARLGARSLVLDLEQGVVRMILDRF
jgi:ankyrin repeat protein